MRDYKELPLGYGEKIDFDELYNVYIVQNYSRVETALYFNTKDHVIKNNLRFYGLKKDPKLRYKNYEKNSLKKYGVKNIFEKTDFIKQKTIEKLGVDNSSKLSAVIEKRNKTNLERFGVTAPCKNKKIKEKTLKTMQEKYGGNAPICSDKIKTKIKKTNLKKYGTEYALKSEVVKEKRKQTCIEKYGVDNIMLTDMFRNKSKQTCLEKYGVEYIGASMEIKEKVKNTLEEKYGVTNYFQSKDFINKAKETMLEKYGVEYPIQNTEIMKQVHETMKKNGSYRKSKDEDYIYESLKKKFNTVIRQYKCDRYPFYCDFYISEVDLFIEYQGYQGHGGHPFNPSNEEDIVIVEVWKKRAEEINYKGKKKKQYENYIHTWTIEDVHKRNIAKQNNLNYLEFFNLDEFESWYDEKLL